MTPRDRLHPLNQRGMTLIELLAALTLLSLIAAGVASWMNLATLGTRTLADRARFNTAAEAALQRISEDLTVGDVDLQGDRRSRRPAEVWRERITVEDTVLRIATRDEEGRFVNRAYQVDRESRTLARSDQREGGMDTTMILAGQVHSVRFTIDHADDPDETHILLAQIEGDQGQVVQRRYRLP